jgi:hypothetical protein
MLFRQLSGKCLWWSSHMATEHDSVQYLWSIEKMLVNVFLRGFFFNPFQEGCKWLIAIDQWALNMVCIRCQKMPGNL